MKEQIIKRKECYMKSEQKEFEKFYSRKMIQDLIDADVFKKDSSEETILNYLEFPFDIILKQYSLSYEASWSKLEMNYTT